MKFKRKKLQLSKRTISNLDSGFMGRIRAGGGGEPDEIEDLLFQEIPIVITNCDMDMGCGSNAGNYAGGTAQMTTATLGSAVGGATTVTGTTSVITI